MNVVVISGRLVREPEVRYITGENPTAVAKFTLAVDRENTKDKSADFINCTAFGKSAENIEKYIHKGSKLIVKGKWQTGSYQGKNGKVYTNECLVERFEFGENKNANSSNGIIPPTNDAVTNTTSTDGWLATGEVDTNDLPFN